ncbi:hypothetical protein F5Y17DRAFT_424661 [Xylariaceae sp. FL0594]|nr:hypothetical protein F5Y17DRAFT_424661 [Xylariaceae sp. FL0594]
MNNQFYNITRDESPMTESPVIPKLLVQNYSRPHPAAQKASLASDVSKLDRLKSRVPDRTDSPLVPMPLFSSTPEVVAAETVPSVGETAAALRAATLSARTTMIETTANPTPISLSPSQFPLPPLQGGNTANSVDMVSPVSTIQGPSRPARPVSSIYSQVTMSTTPPRTPTMTNWTSGLPGIPSPDPNVAGMRTSSSSSSDKTTVSSITPTEGEQPTTPPQPIQVQIQVPRLRSPSLPQDRLSRTRTRTISNAAGTAAANGMAVGSVSSLQSAVYHHPEPALASQPTTYSGDDWPLQRPSIAHSQDTPYKQYLRRSRGSDRLPIHYDAYHSHLKKESVSSTNHTFGHTHEPDAYVASPRVSLADSRTPIRGPGEQRSRWWQSDDDGDDVERATRGGGGGDNGYAAAGMKEGGQMTDARQTRWSKRNKIIVAVSVLVAVLIGVGVALGVVLSSNKGKSEER